MILCRIFIGFSDQGDLFGPGEQGRDQTVYVIDELAMKGFRKHGSINEMESEVYVASEFREIEGFSAAEFIDKMVKPIIIQEHFGLRTTFSFTEDSLRAFARDWRVAVNIPETARAIPDGATGVLVPKPYEGAPPASTQITGNLNGLNIDIEEP